MTLEELDKIIAGGETLTVEFKSDRQQISDNDIYEEVVALASTEGGIAIERDRDTTRERDRVVCIKRAGDKPSESSEPSDDAARRAEDADRVQTIADGYGRSGESNRPARIQAGAIKNRDSDGLGGSDDCLATDSAFPAERASTDGLDNSVPDREEGEI